MQKSFLQNIPHELLDPSLGQIVDHTVNSKGSLSRQKLTQQIANAMDLPCNVSTSLATAIEYFHTASLLLDDLPCMDNATTRRGEPCTHVKHGESMAILSSLTLINQAYMQLWEAFEHATKDDRKEASRITKECLGLTGILTGQAMDLNYGDSAPDANRVAYIAELKTGSLFRLCLLLPAVVAGATRYEKMHLSQLAKSWGLAYQVGDDLLDLNLTDQPSGKTAQRDELLGRPNMALAAGVEDASKIFRDCIQRSDATINALIKTSGDKWNCLKSFQSQFRKKAAAILTQANAA